MSQITQEKTKLNNELLHLKEEIKIQLVEIISQILDVQKNQIDIHQSLSSFQLDSMELLILTSEIENYLGHELSFIFFNDYPNIEILAKRLSEEIEYST